MSSGPPEPRHHASFLRFPLKRAPDRDDTGPGGGESRDTSIFSGRTILVVEDDFIVAFDIQSLLEEHGARVLGPASSVEEARAILARETPNLAVLDVNLNGDFVFPIADELRERQVPFVFATAYADDDRLFPGETVRAPRLAKPVLPRVLIGQLRKMLG
jgi:CheY-like chemotaxis protein